MRFDWPRMSGRPAPNRRDQLASTMQALGFMRLIEGMPRKAQLLVLNYHRIGNRGETNFDPEIFSTDQDGLYEQIRLLKRRYNLLQPEEALDIIAGRTRPHAMSVLLTFDDGYLDNATLAVPVLKQHDAAAVFFLVTEYLDDPSQIPWWDEIAWRARSCIGRSLAISQFDLHGELVTASNVDKTIRELLKRYRGPDIDKPRFLQELRQATAGQTGPSRIAERLLMNWRDAQWLRDQGMTIGLHTHTHQILSTLDAAGQAEELRTCRTRMAEMLGVQCDLLAYPVGTTFAFTETTKRLAKETGFAAAFSFYGGTNNPGRIDPFDVRRVAFPEYATAARSRCAAALMATTANIWL
jgi:peptidoglycan/xylan/chitin deacetylase (PgdA/CDA1 family)